MYCVKCQMEKVEPRRVEAGFITCLRCGEADARKVRHTIVPGHKQGYMVYSREAAFDIVKQLNPKRSGL
jgi:hypothetical protein